MKLTVRGRTWNLHERTYLMGVINVTPDSFSDGGQHFDLRSAVVRARQLAEEGADILDIGGESTRPGHEPVPASVEMERVVPVIRAIRAELDVPISIDTRKAEVARAAVAAGADMINDVTGLHGDADMAQTAAWSGLPVCLMHWAKVETGPDLMDRIIQGLSESVRLALAAGIPRDRLIVDPGVGFGKDVAGNLQILRCLGDLRELGLPILIGTSRKSVIGKTLGLPVTDRVEGTAATVAIAIAHGASLVRVHDMQAMVRVSRMVDAIMGRTISPL
ncbi:MAG TPA: dihydropteroate synthase [Symbiobacteriaceae bacterium]|nr:dihydropteroate synthase [Symbiobacteriaceae bacterium]